MATQSRGHGTSYSVWAHYGGDTTYAPSDSLGVSVTVNPESSTITETILAFNQNGNSIPLTNIPFGSFVYTRADVRGNSGYGTPTGTVTFTDSFGPIPGGASYPLNSQGNTADPQGILFDAGSHSISAVYNGDASFNASSPSASVPFTITHGFFATVPSAQSTVVISAPGVSGQSSLTVSNSSNFTGTISLSCSGLPSEAACQFAPSSITANGTANTAIVAIIVTTTAKTALLQSRPRPYLLASWMAGIGFLFSVVLAGGKQLRHRGLFLLLMLALIVVVPACGGGSSGGSGPPPNQGTPTGTYKVTVNATSGSTTSSNVLILIVQ